MLSFTLSGKHMSYAYTQLKHKTIIDIRIFRHSYNELIQLLRLIQTYAYSNLYLSHSDLILTQILHSWQTYSYSNLILITGLCVFRSPVGVTELILIQNLYLYYKDYPCLAIPIGTTEILGNVYWYCRT